MSARHMRRGARRGPRSLAAVQARQLRDNILIISWVMDAEADHLERSGNPPAGELANQTVGRKTTSADFLRGLALWFRLIAENF
jgi:hypothetical protein